MKLHTKIIAVFILCCYLTACTAAPVVPTPTAVPAATKVSTGTPTSALTSTTTPTIIATQVPTFAVPLPETMYISGYPVRLPFLTLDIEITGKNQQLIVSCYEKQPGIASSNYNVCVKSIQGSEDWMELLPRDEVNGRLPEVDLSPDEKYLAVRLYDAYPGQNSTVTIWIFRTSDWTLLNVIEVENSWFWANHNFKWTADSQSLAIRSMELIYPDDGQLLLPGGDYVVLAGINGDISPLLSQEDVFPGRDHVYTHTKFSDFGPAWSLDGSYMAYLAVMPESPERIVPGDLVPLQLVLVNTLTQQKEIVYEGELGQNPSWSPDGQKISFYAKEKLMIFDMTSQTMQTIVDQHQLPLNDDSTLSEFFSDSIWAPDSQSVFFRAGASGEVDSYIIDIEDGHLKEWVLPNKYFLQFTKEGDGIIYSEVDIFSEEHYLGVIPLDQIPTIDHGIID